MTQKSSTRLTSGILVLLLLLSTCMMQVLAAPDTVFAGGDGTENNPFQIETAKQLDLVRNDLTAHYVLIADIDLSDFESWTPIGSFQSLSDAPEDAEIPHPDYVFSGTFDGQGHSISNLTVREPMTMAVGLFGCMSGAETGIAYVGNFTLENVDVTGAYLVGGAVGLQFMNCVIEKVALIGENRLSGMQGVGGIVGTGFDMVSECTATADITVLGDDGACAGLIAGGMTFGALEFCVAKGGSITAEGNETWGFGSICGAPWATQTVTDCRAENTTISLNGENNRLVGGLLGFAGSYDASAPAQITGCSVENIVIQISESTDEVGGLVGAGKEMMEGSDIMSVFEIAECSVSGSINGGRNYVDGVVGDPACAVSVDCEGGMTVA